MSDARYPQFNSAGPPKVLYSCTRTPLRKAFITEERDCLKTGRGSCDAKSADLIKAGTKTNVDFVAGSGTSTYDQLLQEARHECSKALGDQQDVEFSILEAEKS